jgi:diguanylate cyclase (GGDEF)-like protein
MQALQPVGGGNVRSARSPGLRVQGALRRHRRSRGSRWQTPGSSPREASIASKGITDVRRAAAFAAPIKRSGCKFGLRPKARLGPRISRLAPMSLSNAFGAQGAFPRTRTGSTALLAAGMVALGLLVASTTGYLVIQSHDRAMAQAEHEMGRLSVILADQAQRAIEAVDLVQKPLLRAIQIEGIQTPENYKQRMSNRAVNQEMSDRAIALPQLGIIGLTDAEGNIINAANTWPPPVANLSDRVYFQALKADPQLASYVSKPVLTRVTHIMAVIVAHRITGADGSFLGVSFGEVLISYFEKLYQTVSDGEGASIALFQSDGTLLARYPRLNDLIGQSFNQGGVVARLTSSGASSSVTRQVSVVDGVDRLIASHSLANYPMAVTVSTPVSIILATWYRQAFFQIGGTTVLELVMGAMGLLVFRQFRALRMLSETRAAQLEAEARLSVSSERERAARTLGIQHARFEAALRNMSQALCMFDATGCLIVANGRVAEMFGMNTAAITPGITVESLIQTALTKSNLHPSDVSTMWGSVQQMRDAGTAASRMRNLADGRTLAVNFVPMDGGGWLVTLEDITERCDAEAKIAHMAHHDALTDLPNRILFHAKLSEAVARGRRGDAFALLCLDLDRFKAVNDTLGHPVGDALLREVTGRLKILVRETDTVARLGGDEFAIVQTSANQPQDVAALAGRFVEKLSVPYNINGQLITIGVSIGIALCPGDGDTPDTLLKNADMALYSAKAEGRGRYHFFTAQMDALIQTRRRLELDLRAALAGEQFEVYYQPLMNLKTLCVIGFEALLRWNHPERGLILPTEFVPLAEEIGLIVPLGDWVLRRACFDATTWPSAVKVAVNVSVGQFGGRALVKDVADALAASGLSPSRLELELTESAMLDNTEGVVAVLHLLRNLGVAIVMDDFGIGYSSLSYLLRFPFSKVKIDRSFIQGLGHGGDCDAIVKAVTELCRTMGMMTLAEGVETEDQLRLLRAGKCDEAQGYLFSPPRPGGEVAALCRRLTQPDLADECGRPVSSPPFAPN